MATIANITWPFVPGSLGTLVEYRPTGTLTWIVPGSPANPTTGNTYPLTISDGIHYDVRLTTNGIGCGPQSTTLTIFNAGSSCCPATYTLSPDGSYCFKYNDVAATPPSSSQNAVAAVNNAYTNYGTLIYNSGYAVNGTGTFTQVSPSNAFWINPTGTSSTAGPLNRSGVWAATTSDNQDVGFSICVNSSVAHTIYVGMGADNKGIINVDGVNIITQDPAAMAAYLSSHGFPGVGIDVSFKFWHIYPLSLTAGNHFIELIGHNDTSVAGMGMEVYDNTPIQIAAATAYSGLTLLFSSKDYRGQPIQIGSGGIGYSCPPGYTLVLCSGPAFCRQVITTPTISC